MSNLPPCTLPCEQRDLRDQLTASLSASYAGVVAFITVANEGSFSRAADRLGVGRSAVSRSVQKLEGQIGARLFLRTTRSTTITREANGTRSVARPGDSSFDAMVFFVQRDLVRPPSTGRLMPLM